MGVHVLADAGELLAEAAQPEGGGFGMLPLLIIGAALIGFMMWSNRRRQKQAVEFRNRLRAGQRVQMYAGLIGTIVTIGEREVFIELAPGVVVTAVPQAIQGIVDDLPGAGDAGEVEAGDVEAGQGEGDPSEVDPIETDGVDSTDASDSDDTER